MMFRAAYRNFGGRRSLVVNHSVSVRDVVGVRWYEIRDPGGIPSLAQQGTYAPDDGYRWMASAAMDRAGNIGLGFSLSSANTMPAIAYTGHLASDPPGEMGQGEAVAASSGGSQSSSLRWGDYSSMSVEPGDECTFWYTNEYIPADGVFNWRTRILSFQLPGCASAADFAVWPRRGAEVLGRGKTLTVPLDTAALRLAGGAKALSLSVAELPPGVNAQIEPATVSAGETATLTLSAAPDAELGRGQGYAVRAVAADGTAASSGGALDVVDADFAMDLEADTIALAAGGTARIHIGTRSLFGSAETIAFAVSGLPIGATARFEPAQIVAGGSTDLVVSAAGVRPANTALTVSATAPSTAHLALVHLRSQESPPAEITWSAEGGGSSPLPVRVQNQGGCGCSAAGGGWEALGLLGLLAAIRRKRGSALHFSSSRPR
jgi:MYXO-CTERM domain-containing protein